MTPEAVDHLAQVDPLLGELIGKVGKCTLAPRNRRSPFQALVQAVVFQQLNGNVADKILKRVRALYPGRRFPTPEAVAATSETCLRSAGLSRAKAIAVKDIAEKTLSGVVPTRRAIGRLTDAEIIESLTCVRGVGPWTAEMLLIFTLGRPDVLPATDYGIRKGFALTYGWKELPSPKELLKEGEKWRPYRTTAAWYLWRSLELPRKAPPLQVSAF
jgi:DNA-3-methyladenine glycosylase II